MSTMLNRMQHNHTIKQEKKYDDGSVRVEWLTYLIRGIYTKCVCIFLKDGVREGGILKAHFLDIGTEFGMTALH